MFNRELNRQLQRLRAVRQKGGESGLEDAELLAHWARYLCVLISGFLENAIEEIYSDFARRSAAPQVAAFVEARLGRVLNPNAEAFLQIAGSFSPSWREELDAYLQSEGRKEAIDSIIANRHQVAHGGQSGITSATVTKYLDSCVEVIEFIEAQCSGRS